MLFTPDRNVWRVDRAERAAVLIDAGTYFGALREALLKAQSTVFMLGWDLDSRTRLVGESGKADDGLSRRLRRLSHRAGRAATAVSPSICLMWDYSVLYAIERELFPVFAGLAHADGGSDICLDDELPLGASHHQKVVVVDDAVGVLRAGST